MGKGSELRGYSRGRVGDGRQGGGREREGPHTTLRLPNALTLRLSSQDTMFRLVSEEGMK